MKVLLGLASVLCAALAAPQYANSGVSDSSYQSRAPAPRPSSQYGQPAGEAPQESRGPQVFRHVYVHVGKDEEEDRQSNVIRVPGGGDKHVNIIFVKAPTFSSDSQTEVILPEPASQKTLVYVLLKKGSSSSNVRVKGPQPTQPTKPEVYFIRYKNDEQSSSQGGYPAPQQGYPSSSSASSSAAREPRPQYGTPNL